MINFKSLPQTSASMHYVDDSEAAPIIYMHKETGEYKREPAKMNKVNVNIHDARKISEEFELDMHGFKFLKNQNEPNFDHLNSKQIEKDFYPECSNIVKKFSGCKHAFAFDHNVRDYTLAKKHPNAYKPVKFAHNDYTEKSAALRLSQLDPDKTYKSFSNFGFYNIWQPLREPVVDTPLALISHNSIDTQDLIDISLIYKNRTGKILGIKHNPNHQWSYFSHMKCNEIIMIKCFDTRERVKAKFGIHAAFQNNTTASVAPSRRSIEVRTIAFF